MHRPFNTHLGKELVNNLGVTHPASNGVVKHPFDVGCEFPGAIGVGFQVILTPLPARADFGE